MHRRERIILNEHLDERDVVTREPVPPLMLMPVFAPLGDGRRQWEEAQAMAVEYVPPVRRAA